MQHGPPSIFMSQTNILENLLVLGRGTILVLLAIAINEHEEEDTKVCYQSYNHRHSSNHFGGRR